MNAIELMLVSVGFGGLAWWMLALSDRLLGGGEPRRHRASRRRPTGADPVGIEAPFLGSRR